MTNIIPSEIDCRRPEYTNITHAGFALSFTLWMEEVLHHLIDQRFPGSTTGYCPRHHMPCLPIHIPADAPPSNQGTCTCRNFQHTHTKQTLNPSPCHPSASRGTIAGIMFCREGKSNFQTASFRCQSEIYTPEDYRTYHTRLRIIDRSHSSSSRFKCNPEVQRSGSFRGFAV